MGAQILLVDDDPNDVWLLTRTFEKVCADCHLHFANDGEVAIRMLRAPAGCEIHVRPDLVLLDLNMPKVDGFEVIKNIKSDPDLCQIPIIVLTTSNRAECRVKSYQRYANSFLTKPVAIGELEQMVESIVRYWLHTPGIRPER